MDTPPNWKLNTAHATGNQFAKFNKNHPREYLSLFANLDKILTLLNTGNKLGAFHVNFFRSEGDDLYRIAQTGVPHAQESRLYIYSDPITRTLYILGIGEKTGQQTDINTAKKHIETIKKTPSQPPTPPPTQPLPPPPAQP